MAQPVPILSDYGLSENRGFLSPIPVPALPNSYYAVWESILVDLQPLLLSGRLRAVIEQLPVLSTAHLENELQWRRAYLVLAVMLQGYIWGEDEPAERVPHPITIPLLEVCEHVELPPVATYAGFCLWNYRPLFPNEPLNGLANLKCSISFTGSMDEQWFYHISMAIEAHGAPAIASMLEAIKAARVGDSAMVTNRLRHLSSIIGDTTAILQRMYDKCNTRVFYRQIRPFFAGSKGMEDSGLPRGVWYDDGRSPKQFRQYAGISNAQSSLVQFFDIVLGIEHRPTGVTSDGGSDFKSHAKDPQPLRHNFVEEMRQYMPGPHRRFLEHVGEIANIRPFVENRQTDEALTEAYDSCLEMLRRLRDKHLQIISRYIVMESRAAVSSTSSSASHSRQPRLTKSEAQGLNSHDQSLDHHIGTGGTTLIPFLKQVRNETTEPAIRARARPQDGLMNHVGEIMQGIEQAKVDVADGFLRWYHGLNGDKDRLSGFQQTGKLFILMILPILLSAIILSLWSIEAQSYQVTNS